MNLKKDTDSHRLTRIASCDRLDELLLPPHGLPLANVFARVPWESALVNCQLPFVGSLRFPAGLGQRRCSAKRWPMRWQQKLV